MSPVQTVAAAVREGTCSAAQGETALGVILLLHAVGPGAWSRATYVRRRRLVADLGIPTDHWPKHPQSAEG